LTLFDLVLTWCFTDDSELVVEVSVFRLAVGDGSWVDLEFLLCLLYVTEVG